MSNSDRLRLTIESEEPGVVISVIDSTGSIRLRGDEKKLTADLPKGLYTVRSELGGLFTEEVVRHAAAQTLKPEAPPRFSAALVPGASTSHEYYTYPSWEQSQHETRASIEWNGPTSGGLFLFVRAARSELYHGDDMLAGLSLRSLDGKELTAFANTETRRHDDGWAAFCAHMSAGSLILESRGPVHRQLELPVLKGWQTQLFLIHRGPRPGSTRAGRLLFEDLRVLSVPIRGLDSRRDRDPYDPNDPDVKLTQQMDLGLLALQNDASTVAPSLVSAFLNAKFKNPILGLLGAYLMVMRRRRRGGGDPQLLKTVLRNLDRLLPGSPDVVALRILSEPLLEKRADLSPVTDVPLFLVGTQAILDSAAEVPSLVAVGSLLDAVSDRLLGDSVWTTWEAINLPVRVEEVGGVDVVENIENCEPDWVEFAIADVLETAQRSGHSVGRTALAKHLGVSPRAVKRAFNQFKLRALSDPDEFDLTVDVGELTGGFIDDLSQEMDLESGFGSAIDQPGQPSSAPSYPAVYAKVKKLLGDATTKDQRDIRASDHLRDSLDLTPPSIRELGPKLTRLFPGEGLVIEGSDVESAETVRDIARVVIKKTREPGSRRPPPTSA